MILQSSIRIENHAILLRLFTYIFVFYSDHSEESSDLRLRRLNFLRRLPTLRLFKHKIFGNQDLFLEDSVEDGDLQDSHFQLSDPRRPQL